VKLVSAKEGGANDVFGIVIVAAEIGRRRRWRTSEVGRMSMLTGKHGPDDDVYNGNDVMDRNNKDAEKVSAGRGNGTWSGPGWTNGSGTEEHFPPKE
jgi:hypothetical protein